MKRDIQKILPNIVSPFDEYCSSAGMMLPDYYITAPMIGTGVSKLRYAHTGSQMLDKIVAFDRAEGSFANITQTNMITVSSFNGINGLVWGYDICRQEERRHHLVDEEKYPAVFDLEPIMLATHDLFGTIQSKHFPIAPGQHILCAYKSLYETGPNVLYGALAVAIAKDRSRNADLFMEDHGTLFATNNKRSNIEQQVTVLQNLIESVNDISENLGVEYEKVFVSLKCKTIDAGEVGCIITAAPYVKLARNAVPNGDPLALAHISHAEWKAQVKSRFMSAEDEHTH